MIFCIRGRIVCCVCLGIGGGGGGRKGGVGWGVVSIIWLVDGKIECRCKGRCGVGGGK